MSERVAFLGIGHMGAPMARRLAAAGLQVKIWNRSAAKAEALRAWDAIVCATAREAAADADFVCTCLADGAAVESALFGGVGLQLKPGAMIIDFSTVGVAAARNLAARAAASHGAAWLDAPVSGGVAGAQAGQLVIFAGGDAKVLARAETVLRHVSARVTHMGDVGAGQAAKLCNQLIVSANLLAIAEAFALGEKLGVDVTQLPAALQGGFADSRPLQLFGPRMALPVDPGPAVSEVRTMAKDVAAIMEAAADASVAMKLAPHLQALYQQAIEAGLGAADLPALMQVYRRSGDGGA
jgi:3-hydroxyisobutyrate dehydrogenase-like beta-hydroxyacid dehydrogenase